MPTRLDISFHAPNCPAHPNGKTIAPALLQSACRGFGGEVTPILYASICRLVHFGDRLRLEVIPKEAVRCSEECEVGCHAALLVHSVVSVKHRGRTFLTANVSLPIGGRLRLQIKVRE
jgi:hypothetical protein